MRRLRRLGRRDVEVRPSAGTLKLTADPPTLAVSTRMLIHWSNIAIEQQRLACDARRRLETEVDEAKATGKGLDTTSELRPAMIAIAAASHALDALYGEIRDLALPPSFAERWKSDARSGPARPRKLHEALKLGFSFRGDQRKLQVRLDWLFDLRDGAVHPETVFRATEPHPLGVHTAKEYVVYNCENATKAVELLLEILETCATRPKPALESWAGDLRPSLERLKQERAN
jgi:hypothetical protein